MRLKSSLYLFILSGMLNAQVLYHEDFEKVKEFSASVHANYQNNAYHIYAKDGRVSYNSKRLFDDFSSTIKTEFIDGSDNSAYGLIFRATDYDNFYSFGIYGNGNYYIGGEKKNKWFDLTPDQSSPIINRKGINYLGVACFGFDMVFYINGQQVHRIKDKTYRKGKIGVIAFKGTHIHFDDLYVYKDSADARNTGSYAEEPVILQGDFEPDAEAFFIDNFTDKNGGFSESDNAHYEKGFYTLWNSNDAHYSWQNFFQMDFTIEANYQVKQWEPKGYAGLSIRQNEIKDFYGFGITDEGHAFFDKRKQDVTNRLWHGTVSDFKKDDMFKMKIVCRGDEFTVWIDSAQLGIVKDPQLVLEFMNFGFYASKNVELQVHSVKLSPNALSWAEEIITVFSSPCFWISLIFIVPVLIIIIRRIYMRLRSRQTQRIRIYNELAGRIKQNHGTISNRMIMQTYGLSEQESKNILIKLGEKYNGIPMYSQDGEVMYDFPEYMP
jgi:hypothetical protein